MATVAELQEADKRLKDARKRVKSALKGRIKPEGAYETQAEIARGYGVSDVAVCKWIEKDGWPAKTPDGWWIKDDIDAFLEPRGLGPWRETGGDRQDARTEVLIQQAAKLALEMRALERAEQVDLGAVLLADDVAGLHERVAYTAGSVLETLVDRVDRSIPRDAPQDWAGFRATMIEQVQRTLADVRAVIEELIAGDKESTETNASDATDARPD